MKKAFITGVTGQDGSYLARLLLQKGYEVHGGVRRISQAETARLDLLGITDDVRLHEFDLGETNNIFRTIREVQPDEFYNLAAQSFVGASWELPVYTAEVDGVSVVRILDTLRTLTPDCRFYQASTSEMFGLVQEVPQRETTRFYPRSPYGVAKVFGHYTTVNYRESFGMHASSGILFNHESPLRGTEFVTRKITLGLARIARGGDEPVELGNMDAQRDWGFAGDYVEGMWRMLQQDKADDYVLATGVTTSIRDFFTHAAHALGIELDWSGAGESESACCRQSGRTVLRVNPRFYRPAEVDLLIGDASKARDRLGWVPRVDVRQLAEMMAKADYDALA
ncbi:GDP-mannose 4,6-dehydratase [Mameliella sediminis]|uniref:GDP-mannose 4,6-dehydratase n=1 Tax=Mameliella sediminis TaxID=2836866 RepID=UPI001C461C8B|nr:GDP-mannose 4,6-dehydratase [Mameliella sediminis]MBY6117299.1 GDP-mannose 4,6-dehydratase [Antarctobacter heliothermus]MBY6147157.1 GDP-mannose 4,6-dehydratase [Mameliella alba]MBV7397354.1 GDP-mannose 4,6-dehydratase [Mameliella sediminis]MBY6172524.1 GDP-mannose 4,6-dehydratase [Mameliella alba]MCA0957206.1 GDP-mannose 4,6-dehydratase [Mameliella alba]